MGSGWGSSGDAALRARGDQPAGGWRAGIERTGVERIDEDARTSTPWTFFVMFLGAGVALASVILGWIPITFGLGVWDGLSSMFVGIVVGVVLLIPLMVIGSETATNNATASGAHFGVRGRLVSSFIGLTVTMMQTAVTVWTGGGILVGLLQRLGGLPATNTVRIIAYGATTVVAALIAIYGFHVLLRAAKLVMVTGGLVLVLMLIAFADRIDFGYPGGDYILGGFWPTWLLSAVTVGVASVMSVATMMGDWTRYISPRRFPASRLAPVAAGAVFLGFAVPLGIGTIVSSAFADPFAPFPENLAASAPGWFAVLLLPLGFVSGLALTATTLYSSGLDLDSIVRRCSRTQATLLICLVALGLVLLGSVAQEASDSIAAVLSLLLALVAPWVAIMNIGYLRSRGTYQLDDMQVFNRGQTGGAYWFSNGLNWPALLAWSAGSVFGLLALNTTLYVGPLAGLAGGLDVSFVGSFLIAGLLYFTLERSTPTGATRGTQ